MYPLFIFFSVALLCRLGHALKDANGTTILQPILPGDMGLERRESFDVGLQNQTSLLWGDSVNKASILANVTLSTGQNEMVLSTEFFSSQLKSIDCGTNTSLSLTFTSQETYQKAIGDWSWVNFNEQRSFVLIVNSNGCSAESERQPWVVHNVNYDDASFTARFNATQEEWQALAVGFLIEWGQTTASTTSGPPSKREPFDNPFSNIASKATSAVGKATSAVESKASAVESKASSVVSQASSAIASAIPTTPIDKDTSTTIRLDHDFDATLFSKATKSGLDLTVGCDGCSIKGDITVAGHVEKAAGSLDLSAMTMKITTSGIAVDATLVATVSGTLGSGWNDTKTLANFPVDGAAFSVPGIFQLGAELSFDAGFSLSGVHGSATVKSGVTAAIPNSAFASIDFLDISKTQLDRWKPDISTKPITASAEIDGTLEVFLQSAANIDCTLFGGAKGMGFDLGLKVPDVSLNLETETNSAGVCPNNHDIFGVKYNGGIGVDLVVGAWIEKTIKTKDSLFTKNLWNDPNLYKFPEQCFPFTVGPSDSSLPIKTSSSPASATSVTSTTLATSAATTSSRTQSTLSTSTLTPFTPTTLSGTAGTRSAASNTVSGAPWPLRNSTAGLASLISHGFPKTTLVTSAMAYHLV